MKLKLPRFFKKKNISKKITQKPVEKTINFIPLKNYSTPIIQDIFFSTELEAHKNVTATEIQSCNKKYAQSFAGFYDRLIARGNFQLAAITALSYYSQCSVVYNAIEILARAIGQINPKILDTSTGEFVEEHPLLERLKYPNSNITWSSFASGFARDFIITGNAYILSTGTVTKPPLEIRLIPPQSVYIEPNMTDGFAEKMQVNLFWGRADFFRHEIEGRFKYFTIGGDRELHHVKTYNPSASNTNIYGMSALSSAFYEIEQFLYLNKHNLSLLLRGARPSGFYYVVSENGETLTQDQEENIRAEIERFYSGAENAGRTGFFNANIRFEETMSNARDMDFANLRTDIKETIYNVLQIPLPKVSSGTMTLANYDASRIDLYDTAVLPLVTRLFAELTGALMSRYPNSENLILTYDQREIPALEARKNEQLKLKQEMNIFTINELRAEFGADPLDSGGNQIYMPATSLPIATDVTAAAADDLDTDFDTEEDKDEDKDEKGTDENSLTQARKHRFAEILRSKYDQNHKRLFSETEIEELIAQNDFS